MKIHFIFPSAQYDWPLVNFLRETLPDATFDCGAASGFGRYHYGIQLLAKIPWLACYAFNSWMARIKQGPLPDYICVGTDIEVIGCLLAQFFSGIKIPIIFLGFIYTPRKSLLLTKIRWLYFRILLAQITAVICYSKYESDYLPKLFRLKKTLFVATLFGGNFDVPKDWVAKNEGGPGYVVSAGRSGRDYHLLCDAVRGLPVELHIICDSSHPLQGLDCPANVTILRNCYGDKYVEELAGADMVLLILNNDNLSSGQMVLLNAMALGKLAIITRTATTMEYGEHLKTCYFVGPDSVEEIRSAIGICSKPEIRESIGAEAHRYFMENHSLEPYVQSLVKAFEKIVQHNGHGQSIAKVDDAKH
ncbi:MAG: glycosyltransferase [Methylovulum sp.]|uniref:glycosyltransferase n=1 Tax=Methylovulum sp. TaxID=1916980 RepID=UPI002632DD4A|nr:glycosyltransferase [Methylovulum sp.]MDD2723553.1 glycosyltransferase [Methylovulum sp.]MDD5126253.1 glycosyltransferase [Methylovulum sp.]